MTTATKTAWPQWLEAMLACPECHGDIQRQLHAFCCPSCRVLFPLVSGKPDFRRSLVFEPQKIGVWRQLQANGERSYRANPTANCSQGSAPFLAALRDFIDLRGRILDIGCGPMGVPGYIPRDCYRDYVGIEPLDLAIDCGLPILPALAERLPLADGSFDRVLLISVLDHVLDPAQALKEAARVTAQGGLIHVMTHDPAPTEQHLSDNLLLGLLRILRAEGWQAVAQRILARIRSRRLLGLGIKAVPGAANPFHMAFLDIERCRELGQQAGLSVTRSTSLESGVHFMTLMKPPSPECG